MLAATADPGRSLGVAAGGVAREHIVAEVTAVVAVEVASASAAAATAAAVVVVYIIIVIVVVVVARST